MTSSGGIALLVATAALSLAAGALGAVRPASRAGAILGVLAGLSTLGLGAFTLAGSPWRLTSPALWGRWPLTLGADALSGFFLMVLGVIQLPVSLFAPRYLAHEPADRRRLVAAIAPMFSLSMAGVLVAQDAVMFLIAWELMSLTSFFLVVVDHGRAQVRRAGYIYLVTTHAGALALVILFAVLDAHGLGLSFATYARAAARLPLSLRSLLLVVGLVGFGSKAALVPVHVWLPRAHPVAPSSVSALMSGVMIKVALYGLMRLALGWLGVGPAWWGIALLVLGIASSVLGVLYAIMEHDLKRLLAYHSIENVGIITLGIGAAVLARSYGHPLLGALALAAALFHVLNHALFKSGLFLAAGSVERATGRRDIDALGGLARSMPWTTVAFLVLAVAISGLPPFNGFASEWLTLQSLLRLGHDVAPVSASVASLAALALALTGGLAAACFVKVSGMGFLGPRRAPATTTEVAPAMWAAPAALAALCVVIGLTPGWWVELAMRAAAPVMGAGVGASSPLVLSTPWGGADAVAPVFLGGAALLLLLLAAFGRSPLAGPSTAPWACGGELTPASAYSSTTYTKLFRQVFRHIYQPQRRLERVNTPLPYLYHSVEFENRIRHVADHWLYRPVVDGGIRLSRRLSRVQSGSLRSYLGYFLVTLLVLLALVGH